LKTVNYLQLHNNTDKYAVDNFVALLLVNYFLAQPEIFFNRQSELST